MGGELHLVSSEENIVCIQMMFSGDAPSWLAVLHSKVEWEDSYRLLLDVYNLKLGF